MKVLVILVVLGFLAASINASDNDCTTCVELCAKTCVGLSCLVCSGICSVECAKRVCLILESLYVRIYSTVAGNFHQGNFSPVV